MEGHDVYRGVSLKKKNARENIGLSAFVSRSSDKNRMTTELWLSVLGAHFFPARLFRDGDIEIIIV